jgi:hypothetical protein
MVTKYKAPRLGPHYIKEWVEHARISQTELARLMNTNKENVTRWIREPQRVDLNVLSGVFLALRSHAPELSDMGDLLRPPEVVTAMAEARRAAQTLLEALPTERPARVRRS